MALIQSTEDGGYSVSSNIDINHSYHFVPHVFTAQSTKLAELYRPWGRCLAIVDYTVYDIYGERIQAYFKANGISAVTQRAYISEDKKSTETLFEICRWVTDFRLVRREPVLVIGGGVITDVVGFACAIYRRSTPYIRIPTTLIGLIDASVSNRVAINWDGLKNRIGAYHEPGHTIFDTTFLSTLPEREIRNGMAEIIKISSCTHLRTFEMLEQHGCKLIESRFGHLEDHIDDNTEGIVQVGQDVVRQAIYSVLEVESPNSREKDLDRVMFFGHTWSPTLELAVVPALMHGHAISVDMCYSATLALHLGHLSQAMHTRMLSLFSKFGLALDHPAFTKALLHQGTEATIATRDGKLRAPIPTGNLGTHVILPMVDKADLDTAWEMHKGLVMKYPRMGLGSEGTIDFRRSNDVSKCNGVAA